MKKVLLIPGQIFPTLSIFSRIVEDYDVIRYTIVAIGNQKKKTFFLATIVAFLLIFTNGIQAQSTPVNLNQIELMKQFLGTWKGEISKDTFIIEENTPYGTGMESFLQIVTNGKVFNSVKQPLGYDKKTDKFIMAAIIKYPPIIDFFVTWFTSKTAGEIIKFQDIFNPGNASFKWKFEFISPDTIVQSLIVNDKVIKVITINRTK